jgi:hypothetical protein
MASQPTAQLLLTALLLFGATTHWPTTAQADDKPLIASISKETLWSNRDGKSRTWFHPRACMLPGPDGRPKAEHRMVAGVHATFDGSHLKVKDVGPPLLNPQEGAFRSANRVVHRSAGRVEWCVYVAGSSFQFRLTGSKL